LTNKNISGNIIRFFIYGWIFCVSFYNLLKSFNMFEEDLNANGKSTGSNWKKAGKK